MYIVICGTAVSGFSFYGPFPTYGDAVQWAKREYPDNESFDGKWELCELSPVDQSEAKRLEIVKYISSL